MNLRENCGGVRLSIGAHGASCDASFGILIFSFGSLNTHLHAAVLQESWWSRMQAQADALHFAGSNVALTLCFVRFALYINLVLALMWLLLAVVPFWVRPPPTFRWGQLEAYSAKNIAKGFGMDNSFLVYGENRRGWAEIQIG